MWTLLERKTQAIIIVVIAVFAYAAIQAAIETLTGSASPTHRLVSGITFLIATVLVAIANWAWKWVWRKFPICGRLLFPDLSGKWDGTLRPTSRAIDGSAIDPIPVTVWINQNLFTFSIRGTTKLSTSKSIHAVPDAWPDKDIYRLWYIYGNETTAEAQEVTHDHTGLAWLDMHLQAAPNRLRGKYCTFRRSIGDIDLVRPDQAA